MHIKGLSPKRLAWLRLGLLIVSIGVAAGSFAVAPAQASNPAGDCTKDCGCNAGWNGCCVLPGGAVCLRS